MWIYTDLLQHATPMPEPKLYLLPPERPMLSTELSQDSVRMSSFIDFDEPDQSQRGKLDEDMEMTTELQALPPNEEELKAKELLEKATMLRTRLQLAMHKVQTNQTSKPFSRLDKPTTTSPSLPPRLFTANALPPQRDSTGIRNSPESQIAANRARAFRGAYQANPVQRLSALPMPKIVPTAYSARYMTQPQSRKRDSHASVIDLPSSPPASRGSKAGDMVLKIRKTRGTPSPHKMTGMNPRLPETPMHQLSSPPGSNDGSESRTGREVLGASRLALTSSVVKGEAANGLLELMRAASR
jgi:Whi5 like